jgi:uncharacterized protein (TIGR02268 family)
VEVRIAKGMRTVLLFGFPIRGTDVEVDSARIKVVDTGEHSIIIEALSEPGPDEHWTMRVPVAGGKSPEVVNLVLVSHSTEVDAQIAIVRREPPETAGQTPSAPCSAMSASDAVSSGLIDKDGVQATALQDFADLQSGFRSQKGVAYRAANWALVKVMILPPLEQPAWTPTEATLTSKTGEARVRGVKVEPSPPPDKGWRVFVEADVPPASAGLEFVLQLRGTEGTPSFSIPWVTLPPAKKDK